MSISGVLLGLINIGIVIVVLLLVGAIVVWILSLILHITIPQQVQQLYLALVALIALYMVVALIFGLPSISVLR